MTKAKHTPGPWMLTEGNRFDKEMVITTQYRLDASIGCICEMDVYFTGLIGIEQEANARLIAAAPELLEALQNMMAIVDDAPKGVASYYANGEDAPWSDFDREITAARAAIAKATGSAA